MKQALIPLAFLVVAPLGHAAGAAETAPPAGAASQVTPTFPAEVEMVTVDVVVVDGKGAPVTGLTKDDFLLYQDDAPQKLERFDSVVLPAAPATGATPGARAPRPQPITVNSRREVRSGRVFAVVFDDIHLSAPQAYRAKQAIAEFLDKGVREGDRVLICATSGGAWWTARMESGREELMGILKRFEGRYQPDLLDIERMTDYEAMRIITSDDTVIGDIVQRRFESTGALDKYSTSGDKDPSIAQGRSHPLIMARAQQVYAQARARNKITLKAILRVLEGMSSAQGRKSLILVSEGFINDPDMGELKEVVNTSRRANVALYFLNTRGLELPVGMFSAQFEQVADVRDIGPLYADMAREAEGSEALALATGGCAVMNTNDLASGIVRIAKELSAYYLIGYHPPPVAADGSFHKIAVKVNRKGVSVRARKGYFAPQPGATKSAYVDLPEGVDAQIQQAVDAPFDLDDIPLRITHYVLGETLIGQAKTVIAADIDMRDLAYQQKDGRLVDQVDYDLLVSQRDTGELYQYPETLETGFRPETLAKDSWYPVVRDLELAPGGYQAKLVVRDRNGGRVGSVLHLFTVPDLGKFRASTPVLTDRLDFDAGNGSPRTAFLARRTFPAQGTLYCRIELYNAKADVATGAFRVTHGYTLRRADGQVVLKADPTLIAPGPDGTVSRISGVPVDGLAPGEYVLDLTIQDEVAQKKLELSEPLALVAPPAR